MDTKQELEEIATEEKPLREQYEAAKARRQQLQSQIAKLTAEEKDAILEMHRLSDRLEELRIERRNLLLPPRQQSRPRRP